MWVAVQTPLRIMIKNFFAFAEKRETRNDLEVAPSPSSFHGLLFDSTKNSDIFEILACSCRARVLPQR